MELSLFLAKLLGLYMLIIAIISVVCKDQFKQGLEDMLSTPGWLTFAGALNLIVGLAILIGHPFWELNWRGLITFLGLFSIFKGICRLAFPAYEIDLARKFIKGNGYWILFIITFLLGAFLAYHGFIAHRVNL